MVSVFIFHKKYLQLMYCDVVVMIAGIHISQEIFAIDVLIALIVFWTGGGANWFFDTAQKPFGSCNFVTFPINI